MDPERIRELAVALFLLTRKQSLTFDSVVRVAYHIFDEDGDGEMDKEEVMPHVAAAAAAAGVVVVAATDHAGVKFRTKAGLEC